jgi:hypothetical protein
MSIARLVAGIQANVDIVLRVVHRRNSHDARYIAQPGTVIKRPRPYRRPLRIPLVKSSPSIESSASFAWTGYE